MLRKCNNNKDNMYKSKCAEKWKSDFAKNECIMCKKQECNVCKFERNEQTEHEVVSGCDNLISCLGV